MTSYRAAEDRSRQPSSESVLVTVRLILDVVVVARIWRLVGRSAMRLREAYAARTGVGGQRHGCTSITHELTEADVLLEAWRF